MAAAPNSKLRVMVDANVLFAGSGWPRFAYEVLRHAVKGDFQLVLSAFVIDEAREHLSKILPAVIERFETILLDSNYENVAVPTLQELSAYPHLARDMEDIPVALSAINARVDCLVSSDKDLTAEGEPIHKFLTVLLPARFLREKMGWTSEALEAIRYRNWEDLEK